MMSDRDLPSSSLRSIRPVQTTTISWKPDPEADDLNSASGSMKSDKLQSNNGRAVSSPPTDEIALRSSTNSNSSARKSSFKSRSAGDALVLSMQTDVPGQVKSEKRAGASRIDTGDANFGQPVTTEDRSEGSSTNDDAECDADQDDAVFSKTDSNVPTTDENREKIQPWSSKPSESSLKGKKLSRGVTTQPAGLRSNGINRVRDESSLGETSGRLPAASARGSARLASMKNMSLGTSTIKQEMGKRSPNRLGASIPGTAGASAAVSSMYKEKLDERGEQNQYKRKVNMIGSHAWRMLSNVRLTKRTNDKNAVTDDGLLERNILGWTPEHPYRRRLIAFCRWWWTDKIFLTFTVADNIVDILGNEFAWSSMPITDILFACIYTVEIMIKSLAWGFRGAPNAYINRSLFNQIDAIVMVGRQFMCMHVCIHTLCTHTSKCPHATHACTQAHTRARTHTHMQVRAQLCFPRHVTPHTDTHKHTHAHKQLFHEHLCWFLVCIFVAR
jgi:hypothetical protein